MRVSAAWMIALMWSCVVLAGELLSAAPGLSADYALVPQLVLKGGYNSNLFFEDDAQNLQEDYIATLSPGLSWRRHTEQSLAEVFAQGSFVRYREEKDLDKTDQLYRASIDGRATERLAMGGYAQYSVDHQVDRDIETTGLVLGTVERQRQIYRGSSDLLVGERTQLSISGGYSQDHFEAAEFWDNWSAHATLGGSHRPRSWPNTTLQTALTGRRYFAKRDQRFRTPLADGELASTVEQSNTTDTLALTIGSESRLNERLTIGLSGGARRTFVENERMVSRQVSTATGTSDVERVNAVDEDDSWGYVGNLSLAYRGERNEVSLAISHDLKPLSGSGETAERTSLSGSWWYQITSEWRVNAAASAYRNRSEAERENVQYVDTVTVNLSPRLRYAFNRDLYLEAVYRYTRLEDREISTTSQRHLAALTLSMQHDLLD